jgi:hypothetical protein
MSRQYPRVLFVSEDGDEVAVARRVVTRAVGSLFELQCVSGLDDLLDAVGGGDFDVLLVGDCQGFHSPSDLKREVLERGCTTPVVLLNLAAASQRRRRRCYG